MAITPIPLAFPPSLIRIPEMSMQEPIPQEPNMNSLRLPTRSMMYHGRKDIARKNSWSPPETRSDSWRVRPTEFCITKGPKYVMIFVPVSCCIACTAHAVAVRCQPIIPPSENTSFHDPLSEVWSAIAFSIKKARVEYGRPSECHPVGRKGLGGLHQHGHGLSANAVILSYHGYVDSFVSTSTGSCEGLTWEE